jgi:glycosyl transferase, family 25
MDRVSKIYVINLAEDKQRWEQVLWHAKTLRRPISRIDAINGKNLQESELTAQTTKMCQYFCTRSMIGCFLSHKKAWQQHVNDGCDYSIIFEDDVQLKENAKREIELGLWEVELVDPDWDILYLGNMGAADPERNYDIITRICINLVKRRTVMKGENIYIPEFGTGTHAYVISAKGAQKLLREFEKASYHVDLEIAKNHNIRVYSLINQVAYQESDAGQSTQLHKKFPAIPNVFARNVQVGNSKLSFAMNTPVGQVFGIMVTGFTVMLLILAAIVPKSWIPVTIPVFTMWTLVELFLDPNAGKTIIAYGVLVIAILMMRR